MAMPKPAPAVREQAVVGEQRLQHVHLEFEPIRLFRVDRQVDVGLARLLRQFLKDREDVRLGLVGVAPFVARVERRELDRNPWRLGEAALRFLGDPVERVAIGFGVTFGVSDRTRGFAQHVEAVAEALRALRCGTA